MIQIKSFKVGFEYNKELLLFFIFTGIVVSFGSWSIITLTPLIFIILYVLFKNIKESYSITLLDLSFIFIALSELLTVLFSVYNNDHLTHYNLYVILFLYLVYKKSFKSSEQRILFSRVVYVFTIFLALTTFIFFIVHSNTILDYGFSDFNNYKNLYNPLGVWNNLWASVLLLLLTHTLIFLVSQKTNKSKFIGFLVVLLLVFDITVSFSRGAYLSLIFFVFILNLLTFKCFKIRKQLIYNGVALCILVLATYNIKNSLFTTISFNNTTSQQRSTSGRIDRWLNSLELVKEKPLTGWGNNNYNLAQDKFQFIAEDANFSSRIDNTYLQILIEKGIFGLFGYLFLFVTCGIITYKGLKNKLITKNQKLELAVIFSGLVAFTVREITFSSFFASNMVYLLLFHLIFLLIPFDYELKRIKISKKIKICVLSLMLFTTSFIVYKLIGTHSLNKHNNRFILAYNKNESREALHNLNKAIQISPNNIILNKHKALMLSKDAIQINISNKNASFFTFKHLSKDTLKISKKYLKKILKLNPYDDETYHNLGWIYLALKKKDSSNFYFNKALSLRPFNSTYIISKILNDLEWNNNTNMVIDLSNALRYSPDILESIFYKKIVSQYKSKAKMAEEKAVLELQNDLKKNDNPILKARLARLILYKKPNESFKLLEQVTTSLPNLSRPWLYKAFYYEKLGDTVRANKNYKKAIFLNRADFLPKLYYANFLKNIGNDNNSVSVYKEALHVFNYIATENYRKNKDLSRLKTIYNTYIPNDLLYYVNPSISDETIFNYFISYYKSIDELKLQEFYENLSEKYKSQLFKGNELIR